jgi:hypothetical protein
MTLAPDSGSDLGVVNAVRGDVGAELSHALQETLEAGQLILNVRAEADPERLRLLALEAFEEIRCREAVEVGIEHLECFRPGRPVPTHRLAGV